MKEAFDIFLGAENIGMSPFMWTKTILFSIILSYSFYISFKKGFRDVDILSLILIATFLFRSSYSLFLNPNIPDQALRLLFLLFPITITVLIHFLYSSYNKYRKDLIIIGILALLIVILNIIFGRALQSGTPHWWDENYRISRINQVWLLGAIIYSVLIIIRNYKSPKTYLRFIWMINLGLIFYLFGHLLFSLNSSLEMYWVMWYHAFVFDLILIYSFGFLIWRLYRSLGRKPMATQLTLKKINIYELMDEVPADKLINFIEVNHPKCFPIYLRKLTQRQQLHAILMIHKVSIKKCSEYSHITPLAVNVYRSRIRKKLD